MTYDDLDNDQRDRPGWRHNRLNMRPAWAVVGGDQCFRHCGGTNDYHINTTTVDRRTSRRAANPPVPLRPSGGESNEDSWAESEHYTMNWANAAMRILTTDNSLRIPNLNRLTKSRFVLQSDPISSLIPRPASERR
jgi:hypothetical protein